MTARGPRRSIMAHAEADQLFDILTGGSGWPLWGADTAGQVGEPTLNTYSRAGQYDISLRDIALWVALRENDRIAVQSHIKWPGNRDYVMDPLPDRIAQAYEDLLFGEDPDFVAGTTADQKNLDEMLEENDLPSQLRRWTGQSISEGETWWRVFVDREASDWPIVDANSRLDVVPLFHGRKIVAAAFIDPLISQKITLEGQTQIEMYRHVEIQTDKLTRNYLFKGTFSSLGDAVALTDRPETEALDPEWEHGIPMMLAGRIPNKLGRDWRLGTSEYHGVKDLILQLNEAHTIMAENARNTAKARMVVPQAALGDDGKFDAGQDVIVAESLDTELDGNTKGPFVVLEYNFQADALLRYMDNLVSIILTRVGLAEQFIGSSRMGEGQAFTGTALRTRLIPTTLAAAGKGRFYDDIVPKILLAMQQVSALPHEQGGTGQSWSDAKAKPTMKRTSVLPEDQAEETQRHVMGVQGEVESIQTAVEQMHPDWNQQDVKEEIDRIREDRGGTLAPPGLNPPPGTPGHNPATADATGAEQPGATGTGPNVDGQSPAARPPAVTAGGPK